jgi:hypothetical protein
VNACAAELASEWLDGEVCADPKVNEVHRDEICLEVTLEGGMAGDFQYVSTSPPTSSVTPSNGETMLTSQRT